MKRYEKIKEAKQVGTLYHFTKIENLGKILSTGEIKPSYNRLYKSTISFTRNFRFQKDISYFSDKVVRISLNGDKLSNKYKIIPYQDQNFNDEMEEVLITSKPILILPYIKSIDIIETKDDLYDNLSKLIYTAHLKNIKINIVNKWKK